MVKEQTKQTVKDEDDTIPSSPSLPDVAQAREPLPSIQTYTQSKTFIANSGINPLVAAASALFSINNKLINTDDYDAIDKLRDDLVHEVKAFECAAHTHGYHADVILLARYAICATLDETIQSTSWGSLIDWHEENLLYIFQGESWGGESFYLILNKLSENPEIHIDLLEFMYLCLSLGFNGKYRGVESNQNELDQITDKLYHLIRKQRGDFPSQLSEKVKFNQKKSDKQKRHIPLWAISAATAAVLATLYFGFNYMMGVSTTPIYTKLTNLTNAMEQEKNA